ncbi:uncharacterized protein LOC110987325 [Acanthaster planci]|uniref:Uncharacterized protein LOC110987325 n=1 Tax=Acanthaster planci TaxID=133434 RepID=A0A8B7ZJG5_ACAPL|nr:uncharacterized protein LOC110987325 [Acanthaster planci]
MANTDINGSDGGSVGDGSQAPAPSGSQAGRRYRKRDQKRSSTQSGDSSSNTSQKGMGNEELQTEGDVEIQRIKLNRLSDYEVDNVKMANVFGSPPAIKEKQVSSSMRLNPLYDQNGTVEVTADQAQVAKVGDISQDSVASQNSAKAGKSKKGTYKRPKKDLDEDAEEVPDERPPETKINYSKNFRFGKRPPDGQNGAANGVKKLTSFGVVMPSRVKHNTMPKDQLVAAGGGPSQYALGAQTDVKSKTDIEAASRRHEIRRRWRYVIILILIILVFGLILTVVLYFATRQS